MIRTALRLVAAAGLVLGLTSTGAIGIAAADDRPVDARSWGLDGELQRNTALVAALQSAREEYRASALSARTAFRSVLSGVHERITESTASQRTAARTARDAYRDVLEGRAAGDLAALKADFASAWRAYRDALVAARTAARPAMDTAAGAARASLMTARSLYTKAVAEAFAEHAPEVVVPRLVQDPSTWMGMGGSSWLVQGLDRDHSMDGH